jgi:signal transduction histidine kinase
MSAQADVRRQSTTSVTMAPPPALPALDLPPDEAEVGVTENWWSEWEEVLMRDVNRRVTEFIDIAGHELKTPLTAFKASVQLMSRRLNRGLRPDSTDPYLHVRILTESAEMLSYMDR